MTGLVTGDVVALGVGAFFGAMSRYQIGRAATEYIVNARDPRLQKLHGWHTAGINIGGSFILGSIAGVPINKSTTVPSIKGNANTPVFQLSPRARLMLGVGFCGSFTTFSTYSVDVVTWLNQGQTSKALAYVLTNNVGGIAAAAVGMLLVKRLFP